MSTRLAVAGGCGSIWTWLVHTRVGGVALTVGCGWLPTCVATADEFGWFPRVWRWQLEVVGVPVFAAASWMWLVPAFVAVALECGPGTRVWRSQLDVVGAQGYGGDSLMYLVLTCVAMVIGCDWYPRVWLWQLGMVGCSRVWR